MLLAHFSDPHLSPLPTPTPTELFSKRVLGLLNWLRGRHRVHKAAVLDALVADLLAQSPDHIALTGDLTNISLAAEFAHASRWLGSVAPPDRLSVVPGNHDVYVEGALEQACASFGPYATGDAPTDHAFPYLRLRGHVAIIGVNSAVVVPPAHATGRVGEAQLARLARLLDETRKQGLARVILLHHALSVPKHRPKHRLLDEEAVRDTLIRHGAELVLHGHLHTPGAEWLDGRIPVLGVPSASACPPIPKYPAGYSLFNIAREGDGFAITHTRRSLLPDGGFGSQTEERLTPPVAG